MIRSNGKKDVFIDATALRPAEEVFAEEVDRLDAEEPGWDEEGRLAAVVRLLKSGVDHEVLTSTYGKPMLERAKAAAQE